MGVKKTKRKTTRKRTPRLVTPPTGRAAIHFVTGMPKAASTLFCNLLNQAPDFHAGGTSELPLMLESISANASVSLEYKNRLYIDRESAQEYVEDLARSAIANRYKGKGRVCFDKSRAWTSKTWEIKKLCPNSKTIILVRDLRNIFMTIIRRHRLQPMVRLSDKSKTMLGHMQEIFGSDGMVGSSIAGVVDVYLNQEQLQGQVMFIKFEDFVRRGQEVMNDVHRFIGEAYFEYDFENIESVSGEDAYDAWHLHKFPHRGNKYSAPIDTEWKTLIPGVVGDMIIKNHPIYNQAFGYK